MDKSYTPLDRLWSWTRPEIYKMAPLHLGLLIPLVLFIATLARQVDQSMGLPRIVGQPLGWVSGVFLLGIAGSTVYWTYSYLALEGEGSPNPAFRQTCRVVQTGPYAVVRHPTVLGKLAGVVGVGLAFQSATFLGFVVPTFLLGAAISNRFTQEVPLERDMGERYLRYRRAVPMFLPRGSAMLAQLRRSWRVAVSVGLLLLCLVLVGDGAFDGALLLPPHPAVLAGLLVLVLPAGAAVLVQHWAGARQPLAAAAGLHVGRELMHLGPDALTDFVESMAPDRGAALLAATEGAHHGRWQAMLFVVLPAVAAGALSSPSAGALVGLIGLGVALWLADGWRELAAGLLDGLASTLGLALLALGLGLELDGGLVLALPLAALLGGLRMSWNGVGVQDLALVLPLGLAGLPAGTVLFVSVLAHLLRLGLGVVAFFGFLRWLSRSGYVPAAGDPTAGAAAEE